MLLEEDFDLAEPHLSADGRWLAYLSAETGRNELFVRSFPDLQRKWQVSNGGAASPHWRADGRELVFANATERGAMWSAVAVTSTEGELRFGAPAPLFTLRAGQLYAVPNADHTRFLTVVQRAAAASVPMRVILGWHLGGK